MARADYEKLIAELKASGVHEPAGRLSHVAYGEDEVTMFETWESADHFNAHRGDLMAALQSVGLDSADVEVQAVHPPQPDEIQPSFVHHVLLDAAGGTRTPSCLRCMAS